MRKGRSQNEDPLEESGPPKISLARKILLAVFFIAFWLIYYGYQGN